MSSEQDRQIEELLDRAGRDAQPRHRSWETLPARLAGIRQVGARRQRRWLVAAGVAAMITLGIGIAIYLAGGRAAIAAPGPIQVIRQDIEITAFNETETEGQPLFMPQASLGVQDQRRGPKVRSGMALVKDHRVVLNLRNGDNIVRFTDVAATIDPTSVRFVSDTDPLGTTVVEQDFEFDLATAGALFKRYIDKKITCLGKDGREIEGRLCSYDDGQIVLAEGPARKDGGDRKTQIVARDELQAIRLAEVPADLFVRPTLVWKLRTQHEGRHDTTLSYVCGEVKWAADYVAVVTPGTIENGDRIDLQGWVTLDNRSGSTYHDAKIKLIAGDIHRVVDPWAPSVESKRNLDLQESTDSVIALESTMPRQLEEKAFFEYHLYTLSVPSTVKDRQIKQLKLLRAAGIKATRRYVFDSQAEGDGVQARLEFKNEEANSLGMPLPKGQLRLVHQDTDGELALIGQDAIDHTPKNEEMELNIGRAFDVTGERTFLEIRQPSERQETRRIQLRMRNHKDQPINGRFVEHMIDGRNWKIAEMADRWTREAVNTVHFDFVLGPNEEKTITYVAEYQW